MTDERVKALVADRDAHERHAEELSRTVDGLGDELDAARSELERWKREVGEWRSSREFWRDTYVAADAKAAELGARAEVAEASLARVQALHRRTLAGDYPDMPARFWCPECALTWPCPTAAALADEPAEQRGRGLNCPVCGSGEEGDCICDAAEAIAKVRWEADGRAVREAPWEQVSQLKRASLIIKALPEAAEQRAEGGA